MYNMKVFPIYYRICKLFFSASKSYTWKPAIWQEENQLGIYTYFKTTHLLQLVQRQLQAAQKQASLLEGKGNLYQSVNIPIKKKKQHIT